MVVLHTTTIYKQVQLIKLQINILKNKNIIIQYGIKTDK